jgi:hypothetical protein
MFELFTGIACVPDGASSLVVTHAAPENAEYPMFRPFILNERSS